MSKIFVLMAGDYENLHVEDASEDSDYIIHKAIQLARENKFMNGFSEIEVWENHEAKSWYGDSVRDIINQVNNPFRNFTDDEIKADFYERIKRDDTND